MAKHTHFSPENHLDEPSSHLPDLPSSIELKQYFQHLSLEMSNLEQEMSLLRSRHTRLSGILGLVFFLLGGSIAWAAFKFQNIESTKRPGIENTVEIEQLQEKVSNLEERIPKNLAGTIQNHEFQFQDIEAELDRLRSQIKAESTETKTPQLAKPKVNSPTVVPNEQANGTETPDTSEPNDLEPSQSE